MIRNTRIRQLLLIVTAFVYMAIALRAFLLPERLAQDLGYSLHSPNGYSELFAVYVGVWIATAAIALIAVRRSDEPLFGDIVGMSVVAPAKPVQAARTQGFSAIADGWISQFKFQ